MKSFLQFVTDKQLDFYLEHVENYNIFMRFREGECKAPECVGNRSESEYQILENKTVFKYLNYKEWKVGEINEELVESASIWELESIQCLEKRKSKKK